MTDKIVLNDALGTYDVTQINANFQKIEEALNNKVLYRDNPVGTANQLAMDVDVNGKRLYNLPAPILMSEAARLQDVINATAGIVPAVGIPFTPYLDIVATNVQSAIQELRNDSVGRTIRVTDLGAVGDGNAATFTGTNNSAALQTILNNAIATNLVAQGGTTIVFPTGVFCFDTPLVVDSPGVSFLRIIGNGNSTRLIYRGNSGTGLLFTNTAYDGSYGSFHSRITLENFMMFCQPPQVLAGDTRGISFINCAEIKINAVSSHYAHEGFYFKDTPLTTLNKTEAINCNRGISLKKTRTYTDSDLSVFAINDHWGSGSEVDIYVDGGRDIKINYGGLVSKRAVELRATGSTTASDQIELFQMNGTFIDYQDLTTSSIIIGNPADTSLQIKKVELNNLYYSSSPAFTKDIIRIDSPLVVNVSVSGGYCSEVVNKFVTIGSSCLPTLQVSVGGIGANNCFKYRIRDERSVTQRTELFVHEPALQLNPDFNYFPSGGYYPFGYDQTQVGSIAKYTTAFVTGDCALTLSGVGSPTPAASCVWLPQHGDFTVSQGTDLAIEWIVSSPTTAHNATLWINTANIDGSGAAEVVADPLLTSVVQEYSNGYKRLIHAYKVPNNKVVTSIRIHGAIGETIRVDYFSIHGPVQYRPSEMLYPGAASHFADTNFKTAKFRGSKAQKRVSGEADELYTCRKDAAGTYSWQLIA